MRSLLSSCYQPREENRYTHTCKGWKKPEEYRGDRGTEEGVMGWLPRGPGEPAKGETSRAVQEAESSGERKPVYIQAQRG